MLPFNRRLQLQLYLFVDQAGHLDWPLETGQLASESVNLFPQVTTFLHALLTLQSHLSGFKLSMTTQLFLLFQLLKGSVTLRCVQHLAQQRPQELKKLPVYCMKDSTFITVDPNTYSKAQHPPPPTSPPFHVCLSVVFYSLKKEVYLENSHVVFCHILFSL